MANVTFINGTCVRFEQTDPTQLLDSVTCMVILALVLLNLLVGILSVIARTYPPILAKQPWLVFISALGGTIWLVSTLTVNDNYPLPYLSQFDHWCVVRRYWLNLYLGFTLWVSCIISRLLKLYIVIELKKKPWNVLLMLFLCTIPSLIVTVVAHGMVVDISCLWIVNEDFEAAYYNCNHLTIFNYVIMGLMLCYLLAAVILSVRLRNIRKSFNEYRELAIQSAIAIIGYVVVGIIYGLNLDLLSVFRCTVTLVFGVIVTLNLWMPMAVPLFGYLYNREKHLQDFRIQLNEDSKVSVRRDSTSTNSHRQYRRSSLKGKYLSSSETGGSSLEKGIDGSGRAVLGNHITEETDEEMREINV